MKEKGKTIAVLGSGFNYIYPEENINLVKEIIKNGGAIVSEYPPNTEVNLSNFPVRNRIIAGISKCTIVVEAKYRSGSSITARHSILQGKKTYCIPGRVEDKTSKGTNNLIKKGAQILTDVNEILSEVGEEKIEKIEREVIKVKKEYSKIYKILTKNSMNINELARKLNINIAQINMKLTMMELEGLIEILPGNMIKIKEI